MSDIHADWIIVTKASFILIGPKTPKNMRLYFLLVLQGIDFIYLLSVESGVSELVLVVWWLNASSMTFRVHVLAPTLIPQFLISLLMCNSVPANQVAKFPAQCPASMGVHSFLPFPTVFPPCVTMEWLENGSREVYRHIPPLNKLLHNGWNPTVYLLCL